DAADRLAHDRIVDAPDAAAQAAVANWLIQHQDFFLSTKDARCLSGAAQPCIDEHERVLQRLRAESRLAPAILDGTGVNERVFIRGSPRTLGPAAPRRFLEALAGPGALSTPK